MAQLSGVRASRSPARSGVAGCAERPPPRTPTAAQLLGVWESAALLSPARRAVALLAIAYPDRAPEELARLSIGERDARLMVLREQVFGPHVAGTIACPRCADRLELIFQIRDVLVPAAAEPPPFTVEAAGYRVTFRLPDSTDLEAMWYARLTADASDPVGLLMDRCILQVDHRPETSATSPLPESLTRAVAERMSAADPQAEVELAASCQLCGTGWLALFDIAAFLWQEVDAWARRVLDEICCLARAYGWREADILALGPRRRQFYLDRAGR